MCVTICVFGLRTAVVTVVNRPETALRPTVIVFLLMLITSFPEHGAPRETG
ncbi:hypothetical protein X768_22690 [Mesorhizobium sp. LSJC265A00]|nr:hypothetical protein X768_22690 [Mesorhizobium sp. LSJC265A00]